MALSVFKRNRFGLLASIIKNNWHHETAYFGNVIIGMITPFMYVLSFILFVDVLYNNINTVAGYTRAEMFLLVLIGQLIFYVYTFWGSMSPQLMEQQVNNGSMDYVLVRPVPSLFFTTFQKIEPFKGLLNFVGPLVPAILVVEWGELEISASNIPIVAIIVIAGSILFHQAQFIMSLVSFWTGRGKQASLVVYAASSQSIPLEGFNLWNKWLFLFVIPVFYASIAASVLLGKSDPIHWLLITLATLAVFTGLKRYTWKRALRQYSSASS